MVKGFTKLHIMEFPRRMKENYLSWSESFQNNTMPFFRGNGRTVKSYLGLDSMRTLNVYMRGDHQSRQGWAATTSLTHPPAPSLGREGASGNSPKGESPKR